MRTTNRIPKAIAIVVILSLGMINNAIKNEDYIQAYHEFSNRIENSVETDNKANESKLFVYAKSIIISSIKQVIYNL